MKKLWSYIQSLKVTLSRLIRYNSYKTVHTYLIGISQELDCMLRQDSNSFLASRLSEDVKRSADILHEYMKSIK